MLRTTKKIDVCTSCDTKLKTGKEVGDTWYGFCPLCGKEYIHNEIRYLGMYASLEDA